MANTYSSLNYHLAFTTKNREPWLGDEVCARLWSYLGGIARENGMTARQIGGVADPVGLLISIPPTLSVSKAVQLLKGGSSHWLKATFPKLAAFACQDGYAVVTVSESQIRADTLQGRKSITAQKHSPGNIGPFSSGTESNSMNAISLVDCKRRSATHSHCIQNTRAQARAYFHLPRTRLSQLSPTNTQTARIPQRRLLMATDPGDLVLDPTCGSGTTAYVAEQWSRRWITGNTSRVARALAKHRLMTAKFDYYQLRELNAEDMARKPQGIWLTDPTGKIPGKATFQCKTVPHIAHRSIARNTSLDPIFAKHEPILAAWRAKMGEVNACIAANAEMGELVDKPETVSDTLFPTDKERIAAWFLDTDYDGRTFCICQAFFPDKSKWAKLAKALGDADVIEADAFEALSGLKSLPFPRPARLAPGEPWRVAVKVIGPRGNEGLRVLPVKD